MNSKVFNKIHNHSSFVSHPEEMYAGFNTQNTDIKPANKVQGIATEPLRLH